MEEAPKPEKRKRKKSLQVFQVLTRVDLAEKNRQQYVLNNDTNEFCVIKGKCSHCGSTEEEEAAAATVVAPESTPVTTHSWLSERDLEEIIAIRDKEPSHHRRADIEKKEVTTRKVRNKVSMLDSLRVYNTTHETCAKILEAAKAQDKVSVNMNAFLIMDEGDTLTPYNADKGGCLYESVHNKHEWAFITKEELFHDMFQHQESFKQLIHIFYFLEERSPPLEFVIYKRKIELVDGILVDTLDFWGHLEHLFVPTRDGYYYAIIACLNFSLANTPSVKETTKTTTHEWV